MRAWRSAASAWRFSGRSRERASRSTSTARSRFSRVRSSFSWARRRRLRCLPRPAASSINRRRSRGLELTIGLDPALADHRVHLAPEVGVGERLEHVGEPAAGAVEAVLALAVAVDAAGDRDLRELALGAPLGVVDHHLDLGEAPLGVALAPREDHVLHGLAAHRGRALLAQRPEHRVGDVRLAAAVGAHDHADARREGEPGPIGERLEPLQVERFQIHRFELP